MQLRNGSTTDLVQLDRLEQFDEKSKDFRIGDVNGSKPLRSYTWRCEQWYDQGSEGACVAYALGHEASSRPAEVRQLTDNFLRRHLYWEAQKIDPWEGGSYPGAVPQYGGTSVLAGIKILHKRWQFFKEYRWAMNIDELLTGIGYNGPAVLGVPWYEGMYRPNANGYIEPTGRVMGGHAILARAINVKTETVTLRNSWGKNWGLNGDCYIKFHDLEKIVRDRADMAFMLKRNTNPFEDVNK